MLGRPPYDESSPIVISNYKPTGEAQPYGSFTFLGCLSSYRSIPHGTDYAAAKTGTRGLFTCAREAMTIRKLDIRVNMLSPRFIETGMKNHTRKWYEKNGCKFGGINLAVEALLRIVRDKSIHGRSISVNSEGIHDMDDDTSGMEGSVQLRRLVENDLLPTFKF